MILVFFLNYYSASASVVTYPQLKTMLSNHNVQLFDVREPDEYQQGRIPDAVNMPRKSRPSCETVLAFLGKFLSFFFVLVNSSGHGGRVFEAVPRAVSAAVQREGSWER